MLLLTFAEGVSLVVIGLLPNFFENWFLVQVAVRRLIWTDCTVGSGKR